MFLYDYKKGKDSQIEYYGQTRQELVKLDWTSRASFKVIVIVICKIWLPICSTCEGFLSSNHCVCNKQTYDYASELTNLDQFKSSFPLVHVVNVFRIFSLPSKSRQHNESNKAIQSSFSSLSNNKVLSVFSYINFNMVGWVHQIRPATPMRNRLSLGR